MLKRVEISNYRAFKDRIVIDFSDVKHYSYSSNLIKDKMIKNSVVFGKNGSGKSSLCLGIVDITLHLLDRQKDKALVGPYLFAGNNNSFADFLYVFEFGKREVIYHYKKSDPLSLVFEELVVNGKTILLHDYLNESDNFIEVPGALYLQTKGLQPQLSCVKYVYNNTIHNDTSIITQLIDYVSGMLYFRSLTDGNSFIGYKLGGENLDDIILKNGKLADFQTFLNKMGLSYDLIPLRMLNNTLRIGQKFSNGKVVGFDEIASSGTMALKLFFCWLLEFSHLSFLVIDEFDAFYSNETSRAVLGLISSFTNMQSLVTTHNISLLSSEYTRPDCAFLIDRSGVLSLSRRLGKDIRKNNNVEKMYREGAFQLTE